MDDTQMYDMALWVARIFFIVLVFTVTVALIYSFAVKDIKVDVLEMQVVAEGIPYVIGYQDPVTQRIYPSIINAKTFEEQDLSTSIVTEREDLAIKIELRYAEKTITKYYVANEETPEEAYEGVLSVLANFPEQITKLEPHPIVKPVLVKTDEGEQAGTLNLYVMMKR